MAINQDTIQKLKNDAAQAVQDAHAFYAYLVLHPVASHAVAALAGAVLGALAAK